MANRIYLYNYEQQENQLFDAYIGEWKYEIPLLLYPLIAEDIRLEGLEFFANKEQGIVQLRQFFNLLADSYQLQYKKAYYEPVNQMFAFLEALPYDTFVLNATDVFTMDDKKHSIQAKEWLLEIKEKSKQYKKAIKNGDLSVLDSLFTNSGYANFLEILQTEWVNYGLGYFEQAAVKKVASTIFEENDKFGLCTAKGEIIVPAIYEDIMEVDYYDDIVIVQQDDKYGFLSRQGVELVPPCYDHVSKVFDVTENEPLAEIQHNGKWGVLKINSHTWALPAAYESIEVISYGYVCVQVEGKFGVSNLQEMIIAPENRYSFSFDYFARLFFTRQQGTSKRKYFTKEGDYLGDYLENSLLMAGGCYWVKPNKLHKKSQLIDAKGLLIADEIDQLLHLENFDVLAYRKGKRWYLYHTVKKKFLLEQEELIKVTAEPAGYSENNVFIVQNNTAIGVYDAQRECWLVNPCAAITKVQYLEHGILSIQKNDDFWFYDAEIGLSAVGYDYISNPLNYRTDEGLLFLYKNNKLYKLLEDKSIQELEASEYAAIYLDRYSFRGNDLTYFISFYKQWKQEAAADVEQLMDIDSLTKLALQAKEEGEYQEALRLFEILALKNDIDSWVEIGLLLTDPEIADLYNPQKGILYYEKATKHNHAVAWNNMGALYQNGIGYTYAIKKAVKAYQKAADLGDGIALTNLGDLYYFGEHVKQDYAKALGYYLKAEKIYHYNYDKIAEVYYQLRDYPNLLAYLKKDYDKSYSGIYYGIIYEHGMGVTLNIKKAITYYEQANAYQPYVYATQRLIYYYSEDPAFKNDKKSQKWKLFAQKHAFEI